MQDLGLWVGRKLVRLFRSVDIAMPHLTNTTWGISQISAYKKRIPISNVRSSLAVRII
jgi:hypothetical protein